MKRTALEKQIRKIAKKGGHKVDFSEGGNHAIVTVNGVRIAIPRHAEINEFTAKKIIKDVEEAAK